MAFILPQLGQGWGAKAHRLHKLHSNKQLELKKQIGLVRFMEKLSSLSTKELVAAEQKARMKVVVFRGRYEDSLLQVRDPAFVAAAHELQYISQTLLIDRYAKYMATGGQPGKLQGTVFHVKLQIDFPATMPDSAAKTGTIIIETAPINVMPHAVLTFMELVRAQATMKLAFHRNAGHVLQVRRLQLQSV
jgi:hypothetical protein